MDEIPLPQRVRRRRQAENELADEKQFETHNIMLTEVDHPSANKLFENNDEATKEVPKKRKASRDIGRLPQLEKFEYLDHTADIQFHSWGDSAGEAFANAVVCMFGYMTELEYVDIDPTINKEVQVEEGFIFRTLDILELDTTNFRIKALGYGETFDEQKHPKGTEIKAITYSNMQILQNAEGSDHTWDLYVIVDI